MRHWQRSQAALSSGWICRFGVPALITSDRGSQFTFNIWNSLRGLLQIKHQPTTAFHPQANGIVERIHRRLRTPFAPMMPMPPRPPTYPAKALYGTPLALPNQFLCINNGHTIKDFIIHIDKILKNHPLPIGTTHPG
jgi:hypothetical protein